VLVTGGIAVLGRVLLPLLEAAGHENNAPEPTELDLLDAGQVEAAIARARACITSRRTFRLATAWETERRGARTIVSAPTHRDSLSMRRLLLRSMPT
jgi:hypothetical protein